MIGRKYVIIISLLVLILLSSCQKQVSDEDIIKEELELEMNSLIGERTSQGNIQILTYDKVEVADNVFMKKTIEVEEIDEGFDGVIKLEFESAEEDEITHIEIIPKEFAESVEDIQFSIEPTRIINPDPEVEWNIKLDGINPVGIEMKAKGKEAVVKLFNEFDKQKNFDLCNKLNEQMRNFCYPIAVAKLKSPKVSDCDSVKDNEAREDCISAVAIVTQDYNICANNIKSMEVKTRCYTLFAAISGNKSFCEKIESKAERTVCQLIFEAEEKGVSFDKLYKERVEKEGVSDEDDEKNYAEPSKNDDQGEGIENSPEVKTESCQYRNTQCYEDCNKQCDQKKYDYCRKYEYSGCALDVLCSCNACLIYDNKWCPDDPEFVGCAEGAKGTYDSCIDSCQSKREAEQDITSCVPDCNKKFEDALIDCKQGPCQDFCEGEGFPKGEWASYTQKYSWDSCHCTNDE